MKEINIENHTRESLNLIFNEANKFFKDTSETINRISGRSFVFLAFYSSVISFSFLSVINNKYEYIVLFIGTIFSILFIRKNIFPTNREVIGVAPEIFLDEYFIDFSGEELEKEQTASLIVSYDKSIKINIKLAELMSGRFRKSLYCFISTLSLLFVFLIFFYLKSNYASC
jgi:hypothetical protein